ncbi:MAG: hypothetical protein IJ127_21970 [Afipia sp.]|nr:hypothetical protein [Afipia sp.]MBS4005993.1 hypothetical protein [Afipia sp.]WIG51650.1 MAG: hypothetical protein OJF48_002567 [Afipia sp.]
MRIRSAGLAALVAAAGIWMSFSGEPAMAAKSSAKTTTKTEKAAKVTSANRPVVLSKFKKQRVAAKKSKSARYATKSTRYAKKAGSKVSSKIIEAPETWEDKPARSEANTASQNKTELPATVANARAQALAEDQARNFAALDSKDVPVVDGVQLASADQLTDADRAATAGTEMAQDSGAPASPAVSEPAPAQSGKIIRAVSSSEKPVFKTDDGDPWSKTSLIGKIFIAFGSLLTLASAARLLIT